MAENQNKNKITLTKPYQPIIMSFETKRIKDTLERHYGGETWHGPSLKEVLEGVTAQQATKRIVPASKNIAEYVQHLTNWRVFALEKLTGSENYDIILNSEADWITINSLEDAQWQEMLDALEDSQNELLDIFDTYTDRKLENIVPGRRYSVYKLMHGIIQHDIYHSAQMMMLKKLA